VRDARRMCGVWRSPALLVLASSVATVAWLVAAGGQETEGQANITQAPVSQWLREPQPLPDADAQSEADMKAYTETIPGTNITFRMVPIPGGTFTMGSPEGEAGRKPSEGPQFPVTVAPFWMATCEVTWDEYDLWSAGIDKRRRAASGESTPWDLLADAITKPTPPYVDMTFGMGKEGYPAICMTQLAAKVYCKWLSAKTGRYYRLPTEAEWEYACRAGSTTAYCFGDDPPALGEYAWYFDNSNDTTHPVGQKKPNAWGLHDMHGNVAEWVLDKFTPEGYEVEAGQAQQDYVNVPDKLYPRVARGGSFEEHAEMLRSAARRGSTRDWSQLDPQVPQSIWYHTDAYFLGFRVVRPLRSPAEESPDKYDLDPAQRRAYETYPKDRGGPTH